MPSEPGVEVLEFAERTVQEGQDVLHVQGAHFLLDGPPVRLAVAGRAPRVAHQDGVASRGIDLGLVEQGPGELGERAAVDVQQDRVWSLARRPHQPAVDRVAVGGGECQFQRLNDSGVRAQLCGEIRQDAELPAVEHCHVPGSRRVGETDHERSVAGCGAGDDTVALDQRLVVPRGPELVQLHRAAGVVQQQRGIGPAQFDPAVAAEVHGLDVAQALWRPRRRTASRRAPCCGPRSPGPIRRCPGRGRRSTARPRDWRTAWTDCRPVLAGATASGSAPPTPSPTVMR